MTFDIERKEQKRIDVGKKTPIMVVRHVSCLFEAKAKKPLSLM